MLLGLFLSSGIAESYDLYLFAGQSNMDGRGKAAKLSNEQREPSSDNIIFYRNPPHSSETWKALEPGYSIAPGYKGKLPSPTFGPEIGFAESMTKKHPRTKFAFIKGSKGGSSLRKDWHPGEAGKPETQGPRYRYFIETITTARKQLKEAGHSFQFKGLLWHQGESDSKSSKEVYQGRLETFIERIREDIGVSDLPVVVGEVFDNGKRDTVRKALQNVGTSYSNCGLVTCEGTVTWDAGTHFDAPSQLLLGSRYAEAMTKLISK